MQLFSTLPCDKNREHQGTRVTVAAPGGKAETVTSVEKVKALTGWFSLEPVSVQLFPGGI